MAKRAEAVGRVLPEQLPIKWHVPHKEAVLFEVFLGAWKVCNFKKENAMAQDLQRAGGEFKMMVSEDGAGLAHGTPIKYRIKKISQN